MRVLLVEDDLLLGEGICASLKEFGYTVDWMQDGLMVLHTLQSEHFSAVIMDLGIPKKSGDEVIRSVREKGIMIPILVLTARDETDSIVKCLDAGADDYMSKPFDLDELTARLRALVRRGDGGKRNPVMHVQNVTLDPAAYRVKIDNTVLATSRREFTILHKLMECSGRVVTRDVLSQSLYGWGDDVDSNTIEVHIHNLRKKLADNLTIKTVRGIGYMIEDVDESA